MKRKTFDAILTLVGLGITVFLIVAGSLGLWAYSFANSNVHNQLVQQQITFPPAAAFQHAKAGSEITPDMIPVVSQYAGQELTTGKQAEAYADHFIAVHLQEIGGGKSYAQLSSEAMALAKGSPEREGGSASGPGAVASGGCRPPPPASAEPPGRRAGGLLGHDHDRPGPG